MGHRIEQGINNNEYSNLTMGNGRDLGLDINSFPLSLGRMNPNIPTPKFKASNFQIAYIIIGAWEKYSMYEGELVAKCYYANKKIVWEVLEGGLKNKIEIHLGNIEAIKVVIHPSQPETLEILLSYPPQFFQEINPQPRMHTIWKPSHDFTGGQASLYRKHYVQFPTGTLDKHYNMLLQSDSNLFKISKKPFPELYVPYFPPESLDASNMSFGSYDNPHPQPSPIMSFSNTEMYPLQHPNAEMYHLQQPNTEMYPLQQSNTEMYPLQHPNAEMYPLQHGEANYNPRMNSFPIQDTPSLNPAPYYQGTNEDMGYMPNVISSTQDGNIPNWGVVNENDENLLNFDQLDQSLLNDQDFFSMPYNTQSLNQTPYYPSTSDATNMFLNGEHMQFMRNMNPSIPEENNNFGGDVNQNKNHQ